LHKYTDFPKTFKTPKNQVLANMSKPQIVVIPGAWHGPSYMDTVSSKLEQLGYTIHARQMPAVGASNPPKDLSEDVDVARSLVEEAIGSGNDVIAIVHSWGGIVAATGFVGLGKKEREAEGKKGGLIRVGYLAAFIVPEGVSLLDAIGGSPPPWFDIQVRYQVFSFCITPSSLVALPSLLQRATKFGDINATNELPRNPSTMP
jgi:pimeloyl-ACP methyl ester carboxylesterase